MLPNGICPLGYTLCLAAAVLFLLPAHFFILCFPPLIAACDNDTCEGAPVCPRAPSCVQLLHRANGR